MSLAFAAPASAQRATALAASAGYATGDASHLLLGLTLTAPVVGVLNGYARAEILTETPGGCIDRIPDSYECSTSGTLLEIGAFGALPITGSTDLVLSAGGGIFHHSDEIFDSNPSFASLGAAALQGIGRGWFLSASYSRVWIRDSDYEAATGDPFDFGAWRAGIGKRL